MQLLKSRIGGCGSLKRLAVGVLVDEKLIDARKIALSVLNARDELRPAS